MHDVQLTIQVGPGGIGLAILGMLCCLSAWIAYLVL